MRRLLTEVMSEYFADDTQDFNPLRGLTVQKHVPVVPRKAFRWERVASPNRLHASFELKSDEEYSLFLAEIFAYERETRHRAKIVCDYPTVTIEIYTKDVNDITEIDLEYAREVDDIYRDVKDYASSNKKEPA